MRITIGRIGILALAGALLAATPILAQRGGGGRGGGGHGGGGHGGGGHGGGHGGSWGGGHGGYHGGGYNGGWGGGYYSGFYPYYYGGYYPRSYYPANYYYDSGPGYGYDYQPGSYQSFYYDPATANSAIVEVRVPAPNAEVWLSDYKTNLTGTTRLFSSPELTPGKEYTYEVRARWTENGRVVDQTRTLPVAPGRRSLADFTQPAPPSQ